MNEKTRDFIAEHAADDVRQLALRGCKNPEVDLPFALQQIAGRQAARRKLPTWAATDGIVFPSHLSLEQCSSEQTARYKAAVARRLMGGTASSRLPNAKLVDLTGGFGVDFSFLAPLFREAVYVERNPQLFAISSENFARIGLKADSLHCVNDDCERYLPMLDHASLLFLDPARRDEHGSRTFAISDCTPDVVALKSPLLQKADFVLLKLSPMLDWRKAVADLGAQHVCEVHIVSVGNECKELLLVLRENADGMSLFCVNDDQVLTVSGDRLHASVGLPVSTAAPADMLQSYLYEPNASLMKAGCFGALSESYGVCPLAVNSHLFVSPRFIGDFPGRKFKISAISSMNKRELKEKLRHIDKANVSVRNFPLSVAELRKRLKLSDGGNVYVFATTLSDDTHVLMICSPQN